MIIGLSGYAQSGKDTVAAHLEAHYDFERVAFADPIRALSLHINPIVGDGQHLKDLVHEYGWDVAKSKAEVRQFLQNLGVGAREQIANDVWIIAALNKMYDPTQHYVITDVRFKNEASTLKAAGAQIWRVERNGVSAVNDHISEHDLDDWEFDAYIHNNSSLEDLMFLVDTTMSARV